MAGAPLTPTQRIVLTVGALFVVVQTTLPLVIPRQERRLAEGAWEMYAKAPPPVEFVLQRDGTVVDIVTAPGVLSVAQSVVAYEDLLSPWLCERDPSLDLVIVMVAGQEYGRFPCRSTGG